MAHMIGRIRRKARRVGLGGSGKSAAVRRAMQAGNLQAKLRVGPQNDAYEREADSVASHVMAGHSVETISDMSSGDSQRKCDECEADEARRAPLLQRQEEDEEELQTKRREQAQRQPVEGEEEEQLQAKMNPDRVQRQGDEEEEEMLQTKRDVALQRDTAEEEEEAVQLKARSDGAFTASGPVSTAVSGLRGGGDPLPSSTRANLEPRFGADFSDVRIHTGGRAESAARALNARAFTTGRDVVFGKGEYAPHSRTGGELLAHELTHVIQQRGYRRESGREDLAAPVRRWKIGKAPVPSFPNWKEVPVGSPKGTPDHRARLNAASSIVAKLLNSTACANYFKDRCDAGTASTLKDTFNKSRVYFMDTGGTLFGANPIGTPNIAYNQTTYDQGRFYLASTLLHEMFHVCAPNASLNDREWNAENAVETCQLYTPYLHEIRPSAGAVGSDVSLVGWNFGPTRGEHDRVELNGVSCPIKSWTFNRSASSVTIVATIPAGATSGSLRVINNNVKSRPAKFTVNP